LGRKISNTNTLKEAFWGNSRVQGNYRNTINERKKVEGQLNTAQGQVNNYAAQQRSALNKSQSQINAAKQMRDTQIGKATGKREGELAAVRENYEKGRTARMKAYGNLAGMTYNKGGATDE
jgi:flagellar biosynthesis/type III secretory pathway protein FliH